MSCYPYHSEEDRQRAIKQLTDEYVHLPQFDATSKFFLLPPSTKTAQEIGAKVPRTEFHVDPKTTGKGFATANGFARTPQGKICGIDTGKVFTGTLSPSSKRGEQRMLGLAKIRLAIDVTMMLAGALAWSIGYLVAATQGLRQAAGQMENNEP